MTPSCPPQPLCEGSVEWTFPSGWRARKFDGGGYQSGQFANVAGGSKAIDFVALDPSDTLWLIEAKEFAYGQRGADKPPLHEEVAAKVRDSLACLLAAAVRADGDEQSCARMCLRAKNIRVVLHVEQRRAPPLMLAPAYELANLRDKLKPLIRAIDRHPVVMSTRETTAVVPWTATWNPKGAQPCP